MWMIKKKKKLDESNKLAFDQAMRVVPNDIVMKKNPDEDKSDTILSAFDIFNKLKCFKS